MRARQALLDSEGTCARVPHAEPLESPLGISLELRDWARRTRRGRRRRSLAEEQARREQLQESGDRSEPRAHATRATNGSILGAGLP